MPQKRAVEANKPAIRKAVNNIGKWIEHQEATAPPPTRRLPRRGSSVTAPSQQTVWVFNGSNARFASGVFSSRQKAEEWIAHHNLTGLLTEYPLDSGAYDWAVQHGLFRPKRPDQSSSAFIGGFTNPHLQHFHYEEGRPTGRRG